MKLSKLVRIIVNKIAPEELQWYAKKYKWGFPEKPGDEYLYADYDGKFYLLRGE